MMPSWAILPPQDGWCSKHIIPKAHEDVRRLENSLGVVSARSYGEGALYDGLGNYGTPCPTTNIGAVKSIGKVNLPVILVEFTDVKLQSTTTIEKISRQLNEKGYHDVDCSALGMTVTSKGSVRDYFIAQSNGLFEPTFSVVAKVSLPHKMGYYLADGPSHVDVNTPEMIEDAVKAAQSQGVDFSRFVIAGNPTAYAATTKGVPMVSCVCAGYSEASLGESDMPWPHFSRMVNATSTDYGRTIGNIKFMSYFIGNELTALAEKNSAGEWDIKQSFLAGPGTFVHEFSHAIGLPDVYATTQIPNQTPFFWSMMDSAPYYNMGYDLIGYTAYERILCGWLPYTVLTNQEQQCTLYPFSAFGATDTPTNAVFAYVVKNPASPKEYYVLENRAADGVWYPRNMGSGMLVYHVYFDYNSWEKNTLNNNASQLRYSVVAADGKWQDQLLGNNYYNDLFPGLLNKTSLTDTSTPAATAYIGGTMHRPIYNIKRKSNIITFDYLKDYANEGIAPITIDQEKTATSYDLNGRIYNTEKVPMGVYIRDNKKVIR